MDLADYNDVLSFWFEECGPRQWFAKDPELDETIRRRFLSTYRRAAGGETQHWRRTPQGRLAEVVVLDQFPRNMFRDSPQAFATDPLALDLAQEAVRLGADKKLGASERHCLYLPYMHSESPAVHAEAVRLYLSLLPWKWVALIYELRHKRIIDRFGRYPHRNAVLGRVSTPEEEAFLAKDPGF